MVLQSLDELIVQLQKLRQELPGDTPVRLHAPGQQHLRVLSLSEGRVGRGAASTLKLVSRGGVPVVLFSE